MVLEDKAHCRHHQTAAMDLRQLCAGALLLVADKPAELDMRRAEEFEDDAFAGWKPELHAGRGVRTVWAHRVAGFVTYVAFGVWGGRVVEIVRVGCDGGVICWLCCSLPLTVAQRNCMVCIDEARHGSPFPSFPWVNTTLGLH